MSDDDDFMYEDEEFDFEYDEGDVNDSELDFENRYYSAKNLREIDADASLLKFREIVNSETEKGEWGFKSLKQIIKIHLKRQDAVMALEAYQELLGYIEKAVTKNYSEKSINSILEKVTKSIGGSSSEDFYERTLTALRETRNESLLIRTNLKLAGLKLEKQEYESVKKIIKELYDLCTNDDENVDPNKETYLIETYALEIQLYLSTKRYKELEKVYKKSIRVKSAIPHPRVMGLVYECGGKMYMIKKQWQSAQTNFYEAFKNYDEAGSEKRIQILKYLILLSVMVDQQQQPESSEVESDQRVQKIDFLNSPEIKPHANHPQVLEMIKLVESFKLNAAQGTNKNISYMGENGSPIGNDPFINENISEVINSIKYQTIINNIVPMYSKIDLVRLANELGMTVDHVIEILCKGIAEKKINGLVDEQSLIYISTPKNEDEETLAAFKKYADNIARLHQTYISKLH